ncbi:hypothetical protein SAMN05421821_11642 [Mucilaginibacter lappiensis]|uniref:Transposase n=1 Tax=Mucilaginibacter lappiensis TaxID=354630 RepID=A0ABR6PRD6_9SPHI|nr:hypothetical protein [Mucilaginibacter lappiensis]SIR93902.1 hypothetical protein SAMN05421821_11642 [Mucilaginibacter lappiensis]
MTDLLAHHPRPFSEITCFHYPSYSAKLQPKAGITSLFMVQLDILRLQSDYRNREYSG